MCVIEVETASLVLLQFLGVSLHITNSVVLINSFWNVESEHRSFTDERLNSGGGELRVSSQVLSSF